MTRRRPSLSHVMMTGLLLLGWNLPAVAQRTEPPPKELEGVEVTEHLGDRTPLDLVFTDERGEAVRLARFFQTGKPVILNLGYFRCPMLCGLVLNALLDRLKDLSWTAGDEFEILTVSIDPHETPALAQLKKQNYIQEYGRAGAAAGWHFLVGTEENVRMLADAVGFGYRYVEDQNQYAHPAVIMILTPEGRISRYLDGLDYSTKTLRLSLVEASNGELGSPLDRLILQCFCYDPESGRYAPVARRIMTLGGLVTVLVLGLMLLVFWRRESRKGKARRSRDSGRSEPDHSAKERMNGGRFDQERTDQGSADQGGG